MTFKNDQQIKIDASEAYQIHLLEEKLQIARHKQKVGEVVIRKEVETRMVQVPIRREKLIVERIGSHPEKLTEVVIGEEKVNGFGYDELTDGANLDLTRSNFVSLSEAQELLAEISKTSPESSIKIRLDLFSSSAEDSVRLKSICEQQI